MTELDRTGLEHLLPATPGGPDWDDVLTRSAELRRHRRRPLVLLALAALVVAVGTASALAVRALVLDEGFTGLPPEGAAHSSPQSGTLVLGISGRLEFVASYGSRPVKDVWVYADGRVVWRREGGPYGVGGIATGFLERRLTPSGVELLRSVVVSTGLFDRDRYLMNEHLFLLSWGEIQARNGRRLVRVAWCCSEVPTNSAALPPAFRGRATVTTEAQARALSRLTKLLANPGSTLPASAWADRTTRAYVPSRYAVCFWRGRVPGYSRSVEPARVLWSLPASARHLLDGNDKRYEVYSPLLESAAGRFVVCSEMTTRDARALDDIFGRAGFQRDVRPETAWLYRFRADDPIGAAQISFEPVLPHGQWVAAGG